MKHDDDAPAFQDRLPDIHCFGCGPRNENGLRIKSRWSGPDESICRFTPAPHHSAGPKQFVNGGIIATVIDCHCCCTAMADSYRQESREIGQGEEVVYVTGSLKVEYRRPTPIDDTLVFKATIQERTPKKTVIGCQVIASDTVCAEGEVVAVRVPASWKRPSATDRR
jgi:acyl-coenzyme A thioesterase PaaI-like protein